ncbi:YggS family pyridoxal phosphate-dependent enzyme [Flavihumibacter petaseus]|uniref:Pyridoxal phosphate homeostasis protein n=1 Tax=Flavihumibacter petaseus NBRC 106054 TaxID=1220578 RepID=A0A0E9N2R2_9BACT|nr:YggS family pyridoxal phosphate-dependent enzyme [Flavihumibacter petaseus]GAO44297.1 hypothetical protein FPE01S_03_03350 [Flavihumibacter petaseus NBRC 106054]
MPIDLEAYHLIREACNKNDAQLVAVSKTKPVELIQELFDAGQRDFGENYVQELVSKHGLLSPDIRWHFIGHLQSNKVKLIAPFVYLIHGIDSLRLLEEVNRQAAKLSKKIKCLLQVHIAAEDTKFGMDETELSACLQQVRERPEMFAHVEISGLMGMASFSDDESVVRKEFRTLKELSLRYPAGPILSMGMSGDYRLALEEGSNMLRIGSMLFGTR